MITLPLDKCLHLIGGIIIYDVGHPFLGDWYAMVPVIVAAVGKEVYDKFHPANHTADVYDALATIGGGLLGFSATIHF